MVGLAVRMPWICGMMHHIHNLMLIMLLASFVLRVVSSIAGLIVPLLSVLLAILLATTLFGLLALRTLSLTLIELCGSCSSINMFIDEFTSETEVFIWHIVLVDCIEVGEMVLALLRAV